MQEEDQNRLPIKRDAEQPCTYHYKREERLSLPGAPHPSAQGGFFRRNRALTIIMLDVVLLLIIGLGVRLFLSRSSNRARIDGYSVVLRGFPYEDVVFATLTVKKRSRGAPREARIFIRFSLSGQDWFLSDRLPEKQGEEAVLRQAIPGALKSDILYVELRIGEKTTRLSWELAH